MSCPIPNDDIVKICNRVSQYNALDIIPFIGPGIKTLVSKDTLTQQKRKKQLDVATTKLDESVMKWREDITNLSYTNSQLIEELLTMIAGPKDSKNKEDSYVGQLVSLGIEPVKERQGYIIVTVITFMFLFFLMLPKIINE